MSDDVSDLLKIGLLYLVSEVMRIQGGEIYWNSAIFQMRPYLEHESVEPNFTYGDLEVSWHKVPGHSMRANRIYPDRFVIDMMINCLKDLRLEGTYAIQLSA
jgi:hypothetical protein